MSRRRESPYKRTNPSGRTVFVARYTNSQGRRVSAGTFDLKRDAQDAIDAAYDAMANSHNARPTTIGGYFETWLADHPRARTTNDSYRYRMESVLDIEVEGIALRHHELAAVRRRHTAPIIRDLLVRQKRAASGTANVLRVLSAMFEDAMSDDYAEFNPFRGLTVRANDPRIQTPPREIRVWSWEDMHAFARAAADIPPEDGRRIPIVKWRPVYAEALVRLLSDCGLRIGEALAVQRTDFKTALRCDEPECFASGPHLHVRRTAHQGFVHERTKTGKPRVVPVPPVLSGLLCSLPPRIDSRQLIPSATGRTWDERPFWRLVWTPAQNATGTDPRPHEFRHSWITHLRAALVDRADLAARSGHSEQTAERYTHPLGRSDDAIREAVGE